MKDLYRIALHFPDKYRMLGNKDLTLETKEYFSDSRDAVSRAEEIAAAFVSPKPDFWYVEAVDWNFWTDNVEATKSVIHYDMLIKKGIIPVLNKVGNSK